MGAIAGRVQAEWSQCARGARYGRKWMGVDPDPVCTVRRLCTKGILFGLLGRLFRWQALCDEGRLATNSGVHATAVIPKLVPAALSARLRDLSVRGIVRERAKRQWQLKPLRPRRFCGLRKT